jgi:dipeptidyl aminopeptidase/acylaminoacyl peptidase
MKRTLVFLLLVSFVYSSNCFGQGFTIEQVLSYPYPTELCSSTGSAKIAWAFNEKGIRNVYVAAGPDYKARKLTVYDKDDGQELSSLSISSDGKWVVFVRGGDHSSGEPGMTVNPAFDPFPPKVQVCAAPFDGGETKYLGEGDYPVISPKNDQVAFIRAGQLWTATPDGATAAKNLFTSRGLNRDIRWSPDGSRIAFTSSRVDHAFIGIYTNAATPIKWLAPSFARDVSPRWSADGNKIVFIRTPASGGPVDSILSRKLQPWAIWIADINSAKAIKIWTAPKTFRGSVPTTGGGYNLQWAAGNRITFLSYQDGWPHLYSLDAEGGEPLSLTPGNFMVEQVKLSPDGKWLFFSANGGADKLDIDRRHIARVPVDNARMEFLTQGTEMETYPVLTGDGSTIALLSASAQRSLMPAIMPAAKGSVRILGEEMIPADFPSKQLVTPRQVIFKAPDGMVIHGQLFEPANKNGKTPAIVYVHGGPERQMVLGWHFMDYYSIDYGLNQYLVSLGFTVLSVNYRLGVGYGYKFHKPAKAGATGASEYQDVKAAGVWLSKQHQVDAKRIGIYGGSYGGFLTAMALAKDSKLFAAGVDIHGVNSWVRPPLNSERGEHPPDEELAAKIALRSSPVNWVNTWTSPVLLIHADDDRNVAFSQTIDLARRFERKGFEFESIAIPDDTHHWMKHANAVRVCEATAEFLKRKLMK